MESKSIIIDYSMYLQFHALFIFRLNAEIVQLQFRFKKMFLLLHVYIIFLSFTLFTVPIQYFVFICRVGLVGKQLPGTLWKRIYPVYIAVLLVANCITLWKNIKSMHHIKNSNKRLQNEKRQKRKKKKYRTRRLDVLTAKNAFMQNT